VDDEQNHRVTRRTGRGKPSFDKGIEQLEAILDEIESGDVPLEQCLKRYEQGVKLVEHCRTILDQAQARITELAPPEVSPVGRSAEGRDSGATEAQTEDEPADLLLTDQDLADND
jgi:exodeoxyribonuclease VII small subunit